MFINNWYNDGKNVESKKKKPFIEFSQNNVLHMPDIYIEQERRQKGKAYH